MNPSFPVLDEDMVNQWFANSGPDEQAGDRKTARMLETVVAPRLASLQGQGLRWPAPKAQRELHSLRGSIGSFGFSACSLHLFTLERQWADLTEEARRLHLEAAKASFEAGMAELFRRFPHLREP